MPQGGYYRRSGTILLRARRIGTCPGESARAYLRLEVRMPQWPGGPRGEWRSWSGARTLCPSDEFVPPSGFAKGACKTVGDDDDYTPPTVFSIETYRLSCRTARKAARAFPRRMSRRCIARGCTRRFAGLRCRFHAVRLDETTPNSSYPAQRVSCRRKGRTMSAFKALDFD